MKIIVDADACPSISKIVSLARENNTKISLYCDLDHMIKSDYANIKYVSTGYQNVDMCIINDLEKTDILITGDFGLALLALSKNAQVIHPTGTLYSNNSIDFKLEESHYKKILRKHKIKTPNIKKRTKKDEDLLLDNLKKLIGG